MKKTIVWLLLFFTFFSASSQMAATANTLLWRISGKNLTQPSYLFGTIHLLCADDLDLSDSLVSAIKKSDRVYLELDMDNILEMLQAMQKMKMRNDTTLADLLSPDDYQRVKTFFKSKKGIIPFSVLETYKPLLAASTLMQTSFDCENTVAMEQLIMQQAKRDNKKIKGLETMSFQLSIFDSIPYKLQAEELMSYVNDMERDNKSNKEYQALIDAYLTQQLDKLESLTKADEFGLEKFADILLYNRNTAWVKKMGDLLPAGPLVIAVGAGHLPGERGVISLLRKAGYIVEPVDNNMLKKRIKQI